MLNKLSLEEFIKLSEKNKNISVYKEISGDRITPISVVESLSEQAKGIALLESGETGGTYGRYSYICLDPITEFQSFGNKIHIKKHNESQSVEDNPLEKLREQFKQHKCYTTHPLSEHAGGSVGFISYDAVRLFEELPDSHPNIDNIPDLFFKFYQTYITFDHEKGIVVISEVAHIKTDPESAYNTAISKIDEILEKVFNSTNKGDYNVDFKPTVPLNAQTSLEIDISSSKYEELVQKAKSYIVEGDAFQIVLSRCFKKKSSASGFDVYRALRYSNPSPYMFFIENEDHLIIGASPEKLVSIKNGVVESCPIAGTRPRGKTDKEDINLEKELLADNKEVAEHMMLVDLARNDLGVVCVPGSVKVKELKKIQRFSHVMHITSTVEGILRDDMDALDTVKAVFPAGTLSGAPKIRAMEIIDELELTRRGLYGGAICITDSSGNMDSCIAIRMAVFKDSTAIIRAGAGIVFDSDPQKEAEETKHKANAILNAIEIAEKGM